MTPRQRKRLARASQKGRPLAFIRFRMVDHKVQAGITAAMVELMDGRMTLVRVMRDHIRGTLVDTVLRPVVRGVVRDVVGAMK